MTETTVQHREDQQINYLEFFPTNHKILDIVQVEIPDTSFTYLIDERSWIFEALPEKSLQDVGLLRYLDFLFQQH